MLGTCICQAHPKGQSCCKIKYWIYFVSGVVIQEQKRLKKKIAQTECVSKIIKMAQTEGNEIKNELKQNYLCTRNEEKKPNKIWQMEKPWNAWMINKRK